MASSDSLVALEVLALLLPVVVVVVLLVPLVVVVVPQSVVAPLPLVLLASVV